MCILETSQNLILRECLLTKRLYNHKRKFSVVYWSRGTLYAQNYLWHIYLRNENREGQVLALSVL